MSTINYPRMHVSLYVKDIAAAVNFYTAFFGMPASKIKSGYAKYELREPNLIISFVQNEERVRSNFGHLGIQVASKEEMESRLSKAKELNIVSLEEIGTACCYAVQDKFWVTDPDGHQWEVYYFHEDVEFNDPKYAEEENTVCCSPETVNAKAAAEKPKLRLSELQNQTTSCDPSSNCC